MNLNWDWKSSGQALVYQWVDPAVRWGIKIGVTPNHITFAGLFINIIATVILIYGAETGHRNDHNTVGLAGIVILLAGLMDMIDGRMARVGNMSSKYGALYDSVIDRYSEMLMFLGICYYLVAHGYLLSSIFAFIAMIGSVMVSYTRARAEGLGLKMADVGFMQRPERILIIGMSAILCGIMSEILGQEFKITFPGFSFPLIENITFFSLPIFILAIMANITAINRLIHAKKQLN